MSESYILTLDTYNEHLKEFQDVSKGKIIKA